MARTLAQAQALRDKVLAAYEKALEAEAYAISSGGDSRSLSRGRIEVLKKQLDELESEISRLSGGGIIPRGITPVG